MYQRPTPIVLNLIIINVLVFLFLFLNQNNPEIIQYFVDVSSDLIFNRGTIVLYNGGGVGTVDAPFELIGNLPPGSIEVHFMPVQIISSMFAHLTVMHILFNMLALLSLGTVVERVMGPKRFLAMYLFSGLFSMACVAFLDPSTGATLGASGAISGVAVALAYYFPDSKLGLLFIPIQFKAKYFVLGFAGLSLVLVLIGWIRGSSMGGISHFGHLTGMLGGFLFLYQNKFLNLFRK